MCHAGRSSPASGSQPSGTPFHLQFYRLDLAETATVEDARQVSPPGPGVHAVHVSRRRPDRPFLPFTVGDLTCTGPGPLQHRS
jgi:hypothetical protein